MYPNPRSTENINVILMPHLFIGYATYTSQRTHDAITTSLLRQNDVDYYCVMCPLGYVSLWFVVVFVTLKLLPDDRSQILRNAIKELLNTHDIFF